MSFFVLFLVSVGHGSSLPSVYSVYSFRSVPFGLFGSLEHPSTGERCGEEAVGFDGGELAHGGGGRGLVPEGTPYLEGII